MSLKNIYTCDFKSCGLYLEDPIALPCGYLICKNHIDTNENKFKCESCEKEHPIDEENGLQVNMKTDSLIKMNLHLSEKHKEVKQVFDELNQSILNFKQSKLFDGEHYLSDYFCELRNQIDLHRENSIEKINSKYEKIIDELNDFEKEYAKNRENLKFEAEKFIEHEWKTVLRTSNLSSENLSKLDEKIKSELKRFQKEVKLYENNLMMKSKLTFISKNDTNFGDLERSSHVIVFKDNHCYEGQYSNGKYNGVGKCFWNNGNIYEGKWVDNKYNGYGKLMTKNDNKVAIYEGEWKNGALNGHGKIITDKYTFECQFNDGKKNGHGVYLYPCGAIYEANYKNDFKYGKAKYIDINGKVTYENWINGKRDIIFDVISSFRCVQINELN